MNREKAERLTLYVYDAGDALERARRAASGFAKEDRLRFNSLLCDILDTLQTGILDPIFDRHPDLRPEREERETPTISSELSWDEVRLEPPLIEKDVDDILFPLLKSHWQKVALVLVNARDSCNLQGLSFSYEVLAARLRDLADRNEIEGIGDLRIWRFSEVRLKD
jgi:hypothetical protein